MARVVLNGHQGMRYGKPPSNLSDEEAQSGSATGFSDGDLEEVPHPRTSKRINNAFDPVTSILDKIDAELSSLTRSQGSSSTATDSTVVRRPNSHTSTENSRLDNGDGLSLSQLGSTHKPTFTPLSSGSQRPGSSDRDTGIGTGASSFRDDSLQHRSLEHGLRDLEPGDSFKDGSHRRPISPELAYLNGHQHMGQSDDDKSQREKQTGSPYEAKQVDDKFKEIMQKRRGGFLSRASADEDTQTIRTEDFVDKFQDTLVYSSDGRSSPRPLPRPLVPPRRKLTPTVDSRPRKANGPGVPPVYPKPTPTSTLPRPSTRSPLKFSPGHASDADSVKTEDFENSFRDMMVTGNQTGESDIDGLNDPIHKKVKQLLKATAKYEEKPLLNYPVTASILKSRFRASEDKPKPDFKSKQHVRISPQPPQYQNHDKGEESDDTLCSDKEDRVISPRQESRQETNHGSRRDSGHDIRLNCRRDSGHDNRRDGGDSVAETHREIEQESERIRKEMERERRAKSFSPARDRSPTRTYLTVTASPKTSIHREIKPDAGGRQSLSDEEKERSAELKATQSALEITENALFEARGNLKAVQAQYEDARTQLMLSEYRKENTSKELVRMSDDLRRKQKESKNLDTATRNKQEELKQFDDIGFTKEEAIQIIESNEAMKSRLRNLDAIHAERDELIQQLEGTKQELFHEQKKARTKIEELKEEVENVTSTCEQMQTEKDEFDKKMQKLESAYKQMEKEKNELIQEKTRQYEEERDKLKSERSELRKRNHDEVESIRKDLIKMTNQVAALQDEVRSKDEINLQLRDQILEHQQKSEQAMTSRSSIVEEHKRTLQTLRKETDTAMVQMRESLFLEKQKTVDTLRDELEQERRDIAARAEERYEGQIADQAAIIKAKNNELSHLVKLVDKLEKEKTRIKVKVDDEVKMEVQEAVSKERKVMEQEQDWAVRKEREGLQAEHRYTLKKLQDELAIEKQQKLTLENQLKDLKNMELEDVRNANKSAVHEKLVAVARAKELMRQEHQADVDRIKEQLKNEYKKETDRLRETVRIQEEELRQFREERLRYVKQQKEANQSMDRTERTLINEINEECRKTSEVLGLTPRKVNINSYRDNGYVSSPAMTNNSSTKVPTTAALANLRACNEELRMHVTDLQHEMEVQRNSVNLAAREKDEALTNLKRQLEREKEEEISRLKEKLVKGLSTNEYRSLLYTPDNEAAFRQTYQVKSHPMERQMRQMSDSQQRDLDRLEREINKLAMNQSPMMDGAETQEDINYAKNLAHLQDKVKQLQAENNGLRRAKLNTVSSSTPDLSSPNMYSSQNYRKFMPRPTSPSRDQQRIASALELRMKEHDYETEVLTEHQKRSRDTMSRKMAEMSKLQNTLTNQAKELIQLEKSYTQLNQHAKSPRPRSSLR